MLTVCGNTKRYAIVTQDFTDVSDVWEPKIGDYTPESPNSDSVVGEDES